MQKIIDELNNLNKIKPNDIVGNIKSVKAKYKFNNAQIFHIVSKCNYTHSAEVIEYLITIGRKSRVLIAYIVDRIKYFLIEEYPHGSHMDLSKIWDRLTATEKSKVIGSIKKFITTLSGIEKQKCYDNLVENIIIRPNDKLEDFYQAIIPEVKAFNLSLSDDRFHNFFNEDIQFRIDRELKGVNLYIYCKAKGGKLNNNLYLFSKHVYFDNIALFDNKLLDLLCSSGNNIIDFELSIHNKEIYNQKIQSVAHIMCLIPLIVELDYHNREKCMLDNSDLEDEKNFDTPEIIDLLGKFSCENIDERDGVISPKITLFMKKIKDVAKKLKIDEYDLFKVVYIHELAHYFVISGYTFNGQYLYPFDSSGKFNSNMFGLGSFHETLAQIITYFILKGEKSPLKCFKTLNKNQPYIYKLWKPFTRSERKIARIINTSFDRYIKKRDFKLLDKLRTI